MYNPRSLTPEYRAWAGMRARCRSERPNVKKHYGGRGIKVCSRWENSFENFLADIGHRPTDRHSLDRIDNNGNYEPGNCRWATWIQQANNKRNIRPEKAQRNLTRIRKGVSLNNIDISDKAHRKLKGMAASHQPKTSLRGYCAWLLEQFSEGSNGLYAALHPKRQK